MQIKQAIRQTILLFILLSAPFRNVYIKKLESVNISYTLNGHVLFIIVKVSTSRIHTCY